MSIFTKYFKNKPDLEKMTEVQINNYIETLNTRITEETITCKLSSPEDSSKEKLYKLMAKRDEAKQILEKKFSAPERH